MKNHHYHKYILSSSVFSSRTYLAHLILFKPARGEAGQDGEAAGGGRGGGWDEGGESEGNN